MKPNTSRFKLTIPACFDYKPSANNRSHRERAVGGPASYVAGFLLVGSRDLSGDSSPLLAVEAGLAALQTSAASRRAGIGRLSALRRQRSGNGRHHARPADAKRRQLLHRPLPVLRTLVHQPATDPERPRPLLPG